MVIDTGFYFFDDFIHKSIIGKRGSSLYLYGYLPCLSGDLFYKVSCLTYGCNKLIDCIFGLAAYKSLTVIYDGQGFIVSGGYACHYA